MACFNCNQSWFWQKLGRCKQCMLSCAVLSVLMLGALYFVTPTEVVYRLSLYLAAAAIFLLTLAHGIMWCVYRLRGEPKTKAGNRSRQ